MKSTVVTVQNKSGLHARPASIFVKLAKEFEAVIEVKKNEKKVNGKSMLGLLSISVNPTDEIELIATGSDEEKAIEALEELFRTTLRD